MATASMRAIRANVYAALESSSQGVIAVFPPLAKAAYAACITIYNRQRSFFKLFPGAFFDDHTLKN